MGVTADLARPELPQGNQGQAELRDVLQLDPDSFALLHTVGLEEQRQTVCQLIHCGCAQIQVEVSDCQTLRLFLHSTSPGVPERISAKPVLFQHMVDVTRVEAGPGAASGGHGGAPSADLWT